MPFVQSFLIFIATILVIWVALKDGSLETSSTPQQKLKVFIIPHSHFDPGWKNTFDEYYSHFFVQHMNTVVEALLQNKKRTFHVHPTIFFQKWFEEHHSKKSKTGITYEEAIQKLLKLDQLDFVGCGIVQHDEALTTWPTQIYQMNFGCNYLKSKLGIDSQVVWQNDAFGHSSLSPYLFQRLGFDYILLNRISENIKQDFRNKQSLEFFWKFLNHTPILATILYKHYHTPMLDFEYRKSDLDTLASQLREDILKKSKAFRHENYLLIWGDDFRFFDSVSNFHQMEALINTMHQKYPKEFEFEFSTISNYFKTVSKYNTSLPHVQSNEINFITYADQYPLDVWTGYYATRPQLKGLIRDAESMLHMTELVHSWNLLFSKNKKQEHWLSKIEPSRNRIYINAHHDAITGTATDHVALDYKNQLKQGKHTLNQVLKEMNSSLFTVVMDHSIPKETLSFVIFNAKSWKRTQLVSLSIQKQYNTLKCSNQKEYPIINFEKECFVRVTLEAWESISCELITDATLEEKTEEWEGLQWHTSSYGDVKIQIENHTLLSQQFKFYISSKAVDFLSSGPYLFRVHWFHIPLIGMIVGILLVILVHFMLEIPHYFCGTLFALCFLYKHFELRTKSTLFKAFASVIVMAKLILFVSYQVIPMNLFNYYMDNLLHWGIPIGIVFGLIWVSIIGKRNLLLCILILLITTVFSYLQSPEDRSHTISFQTIQNKQLKTQNLQMIQFTQQFGPMQWNHQITFQKGTDYLDWKMTLKHDNSKEAELQIWNRDLISQFHFQPIDQLFSTFFSNQNYSVDVNHFYIQQVWNNPLHFIPQKYKPITSMIQCNQSFPMLVSQSVGGTCIESNTVEFMVMRYLAEDDDRGLRIPLINHWKEEQPMSIQFRIPFTNQQLTNEKRYKLTEEMEPFFIHKSNTAVQTSVPKLKAKFEQYLQEHKLYLLPLQTELVEQQLYISFRIFAPDLVIPQHTEQKIEFPFTSICEMFEETCPAFWSLHRTSHWILSKSKLLPMGPITEALTTFVIRKL